MKKAFILILFLVSVAVGQERIKVATSASPSDNILTYLTVTGRTNLFVPGNGIIGGSFTVSNSFIGLGTINTLVNQTLSGGSSIITRDLGDTRYFQSSSTNQFVDTNNTVFVNALTNGVSSGTGFGLISGIANRTFTLKDLIAGAGMSFSSNGNSITLVSTASGGGDVFTSSNNTFVVNSTNTFNGALLTSNIVVRGSATLGTNGGFVVNSTGNITKVGNDSGALWSIDSTGQSRLEGGSVTNFIIRNINAAKAVVDIQADGADPQTSIRFLVNGTHNLILFPSSNSVPVSTVFEQVSGAHIKSYQNTFWKGPTNLFESLALFTNTVQITPGAVAGHVWTSTNSTGVGAWQAPSTAGGLSVTNQSWTLAQATTLTANTFSNLVSITTLTNRGHVDVKFSCYITLSSAAGAQALARVSCGTTNWDNPRVVANLPSGTDDNVLIVSFSDQLHGSPKTYDFKIASNGANVVPITTTVAGQATTNMTRVNILHWY